jgi:ribonuclease BN (tRNA processing enzyme)
MQILSGQMASVYFPVGVEQFGATLSYAEIAEGSVALGGVHFDTLSSLHPGRALLYRLSHAGKNIVYATDNELPGNWRELTGPAAHEMDRFLDFYRGADLLIHDAQYTPQELERRRGWGHSAWPDVLDAAIAAEVKHLVLFHHDPDHSDSFLDGIRGAVQQRLAGLGSSLICDVAREGDLLII